MISIPVITMVHRLHHVINTSDNIFLLYSKIRENFLLLLVTDGQHTVKAVALLHANLTYDKNYKEIKIFNQNEKENINKFEKSTQQQQLLSSSR